MNPKRMVEMCLTKMSFKHKIFYIEQKSYREGKVYNNYKIKIGNKKMEEFNSLTRLLLFLKEVIGQFQERLQNSCNYSCRFSQNRGF